MSAKEMFEEINFNLYEETNDYITYRRYPNTVIDDNSYQEIFFNKSERFIVVSEYYKGDLEEKFILISELKAINKQCEELGWFDEIKIYNS